MEFSFNFQSWRSVYILPPSGYTYPYVMTWDVASCKLGISERIGVRQVKEKNEFPTNLFSIHKMFCSNDLNSSKWLNTSMLKNAVLVARKLLKIWNVAPAAVQSSIAAGNVSVHTGPNTNLFAIKMNKFGRISRGKRLNSTKWFRKGCGGDTGIESFFFGR